MEFLVMLLVLIALDIVAMRWGSDSNDGVDSPEWELRRNWIGFH